ncbi:adenosine deaminase [Paracoccus sp. Z330]|uniref:Adenosine deaminase n=1 Tax=Paracoccus onchidii TaxID=3017813 RepID=A0ABT4ZEP5_9RHOB|nr:adenosine deaminase [Paracoccus onchidii]MDB6177816.1 adenosine deaminase [Paracoccus onchidii]
MKKTELHLHLEGAAPPSFIRAIAAEKRVDLTGVFDARGHYAYDDFPGFLKVYEAATSVLKTPRDYARLLAEVLERSAEEGVIYTELFVSPEFCGGADLSAWRDYLGAMTEVSQQMKGNGIESRAIVTAIRHLGPDRARKSAICAAETAGDWITGFGMGGAETVGKATDFTWSFDCAGEAGLGLTCHAGEWGGPESVREAIALGCTRIGHGVRAIEDQDLVRDIVERDILLEVCPGSNIALGLFPDWASHPISRLADAGVRLCVSTDDPPFFHTSLRHEYERLASAFGWGEEEFRKFNQWAVESSFCDNETQQRLRKEFA